MKKPFKLIVSRAGQVNTYHFGLVENLSKYLATQFTEAEIGGSQTIHAGPVTYGVQGFTVDDLVGFDRQGDKLRPALKPIGASPRPAQPKPAAPVQPSDEFRVTPSRYGEFRVMTLRETPKHKAQNSDHVATYYRENIKTSPWFDPQKEVVVVIVIDTRQNVIGHHVVSIGTLDTCLVHPREVFKPIIVAGAQAFFILHNHPSGDPTPSEADIRVTRDIARGGQLLKIECLDHLIMGDLGQGRSRDYVSLRELGFFYQS